MEGISIVQVESELGAGTRGSSLGPMAVLIEDYKSQRRLAHLNRELIPNTYGGLVADGGFNKAKRIDDVISHSKNVAKGVHEALWRGDFPLIFSGDHSNAYGTICGVKKFVGNKRLGVIWVDAHADLHSAYTTPSGNMHGMPLGIAVAEDYKQGGEEFSDNWDEIVELENTAGKLLPTDIAFIAVRDTEDAERGIMEKHRIQNIEVNSVRSEGIEDTVKRTLEYLEDCEQIYVSFDVDSMDPDMVSRGTGTPVPNGLSLEEAIEINKGLVKDPRVIAWEMTEVNPLLDTKNKMAESALKVVYGVLDSLNKRS